MNRKICVVTGSRAEYGLLRWVMQEISDDPNLDLQLVVTGMHLSPAFGSTVEEIESDGFRPDAKVEVLTDLDSPAAVTRSMGRGLIGFADIFERMRPDVVVLLGDRYEIFVAATAALMACIPIAHIHGGELTEGAIDDALRHSITKMSQLHFVAAAPYKERVIQLGEDPASVHLVGGLGIDSIRKIHCLSKVELETALDIKFAKRSLLVTFHPVTLEPEQCRSQMQELLDALITLTDTTLLFTMPNADTGGREIMALVETFVEKRNNAYAFTSLGQLKYFSCIEQVDGVIGNSSSGLTEVPTFHKGTINIGNRQKGRLQAKSVIDCKPNKTDITEAIKELYSPEFQRNLVNITNPYGDGGASKRIVSTLRGYDFSKGTAKKFWDQNEKEMK
jgi:GDP/UDP-N,N'-diacetylbacillosamine 2-epimerase (hydrolysing)